MNTQTLILLMAAASVAAEQYVNEIYFAVDSSVLDYYVTKLGYDEKTARKTLEGDIDYTIYQVNEAYKSLEDEYSLNLAIRAKRLDILDTSIFNASLLNADTGLQIDVAVDRFKRWLIETDAANRIGYDMALLWTGYELAVGNGNKGVAGFAYDSGTCDPDYNFGVVEFKGIQDDVTATAHEIGHSLGAMHDGTGNCDVSDGYVMEAGMWGTSTNRWQFSYCSYQAFFGHISTLTSRGKNCLEPNATTTQPSTFDMSSQLGRDILDVENICRRKMATNKALFYNIDGVHGAGNTSVCHFLGCKKVNMNGLAFVPSTEGIVCDVGKRCNKGQCLPAPSNFPTPSNLTRECLYGDLHLGGLGPCIGYIQKGGKGHCYDKLFRKSCCSSCADVMNITAKGCEYGDVLRDCEQRVRVSGMSVCYNHYIGPRCCETCGKLKSDMNGCEYGDREADCKTKIEQSGIGECYKEDVLGKCCETCSKVKLNITDCEYGDHDEECDTYDLYIICTNDFNTYSCCGTCSSYHAKRSLDRPSPLPVHPMDRMDELAPPGRDDVRLDVDGRLDEPIGME